MDPKQANLPKSCPWPLLAEAQLTTDTPSRRDGITQRDEDKGRSNVVSMLKAAGEALHLQAFTIATAIVFWQRYYAVKSVKKNDRFVMAIAALFLACKAEDEPRALKDCMVHCWRHRFRRDPKMFDQIPEKDKQMTAKLRETVLLGERAMLYTLGFQFYIHHPYYTVLEVVNKLAKSTTSEIAAFWDKMLKKHLQITWNFLNDSYRTTLCLQYDMRFIGIAALHLTFGLLHLKPPLVKGRLWWQDFCPDLTSEQLEIIKDSIYNLYESTEVPSKDRAVQGAPGIQGGAGGEVAASAKPSQPKGAAQGSSVANGDAAGPSGAADAVGAVVAPGRADAVNTVVTPSRADAVGTVVTSSRPDGAHAVVVPSRADEVGTVVASSRPGGTHAVAGPSRSDVSATAAPSPSGAHREGLPNGSSLHGDTGAVLATPPNQVGDVSNCDANGVISSCESKAFPPKVGQSAVHPGTGSLVSVSNSELGARVSVGQKRRMSESPLGEGQPAQKVVVSESRV